MTTAPSRSRPTLRRGENMLTLGNLVAIPYSPRSAVLAVVSILVILVLATGIVAWGPMGVGPAELSALLRGEAEPSTIFVLERLRGPRVLVAIGVGIALGLAGALFQTVTRNPLGSPDVIGLSAGAGAGVAVATMFFPGMVSASVGSLIGAAVAVGLVWISTGLGFASPSRVIVTGIGVAAMSLSITHYVVALDVRDSASQLAAYLAGSLGARNMEHATTIGIALLVLIPAVIALSHHLTPMDMGDELADTLGSSATSTRTWAIVLAVILAAMAVSVSGPIAFVALSTPHIARQATRTPGPHLFLSALVGALIMLAADFLVQHVPLFDGLPVGVITTGVGGVYLGYLLISTWRRSTR